MRQSRQIIILNLLLVGLWARLCLIPYCIIGPIVLGAVMVGAYSTFVFLGLLPILMSRTLYSKVSIQEEAEGSK